MMDQETILELRFLKALKESCEKEGIKLRDYLLYRLDSRLIEINNTLDTIAEHLENRW